MRQAHPELLTTLRDVAATAVTLLDTFAQIRRERTTPPPPAASPTPQDDPDDQPDASADLDDAPDPCPATPPRPTDDAAQVLSKTISQELFEGCLRSLARDKLLLEQRATARQHAASIRQRLLAIAELATAAIERDDAQTLLLLDARLGHLLVDACDQPVAAASDLEHAHEAGLS